MYVVVTGSSGRIGQTVVRDLLAHGHDVLPVDRRDVAGGGGGGGSPNPPTRLADMTKIDDVMAVLDRADAVVHLGNIPWIDPGFAPAAVSEAFTNNVAANFNLFEAADRLGTRRIVYASSIQAYGTVGGYRTREIATVPQYLPIDEDHPLQACNPYALTKMLGEGLARGYASRRPDASVFSLRFTYVVDGPPRAAGPMAGANEKSPTVEQQANGLRGSMGTFVNVADAARAVRLSLESGIPGHTPLNVASPHSMFRWTREAIASVYGRLPEFRRELRPEEALICTRRAERVIGFRAESAP